MSTTAEKIAVMQAFERGEDVESKGYGSTDTWIQNDDPAWSWGAFDYRIKPKPREWWGNVYAGDPDVVLRKTKEIADEMARKGRIECVHVREVL